MELSKLLLRSPTSLFILSQFAKKVTIPSASQYSSADTANYRLAIHTSSPDLGLAISNVAGDVRSQTWSLGRDLSTHLHVCLAEFLQPQTWVDLAFIAVARGPGSFTGTRIGVVTARTLAQQLHLPLFSISTLAALAWAQRSTAGSEIVAVQMQAQRGEIFGAIYQTSESEAGLHALLPDAVMSLDAWQKILDCQPTPYHLIRADGNLGSSVSSLLGLADLDWKKGKRPHWSEALPFYGQHPVEAM